ncbi:MAG: HAMP domain-containing protein [Candidatus Aureabacteria bacterium]|nr:HAMP domain-containing protein [Candidatus Auribacterota bacterium]
MTDSIKNRRKNHFIKKKFQSIFILKFCTLVVIGAFISTGIIYALSKATVTTSFENSRLIIKSTSDFILPIILLSSTIVILLIGLATIFVTLYSSHKIAGPLFRLEKDMQEVASGNFKKTFFLREHDEIKELAISLDTMTSSIRNSIADVKEKITELEKELSDSTNNEALNKLKEIKDTLSKFQT